MNVLILRIIKIAVFFLVYYLASKIIYTRLKNFIKCESIFDPEIVAISVIIAALFTGIASMILKIFLK
ncbi:MAG TPA: hypothetical protein PKX79_02540 [Spirochaetota bacterium]|jgi:hypothetical protein|nr:hypothetical protein [Spirochaetota bacterium]OQA98471.1 MAG: hypothetical protein BWY23_01090 [Spirochaetes bacterium ADurb.Bin218]HOK01515.1 hypothetical protein [Spirochaetota bacterium]HOK92143.1 hypothetical protein [Spirochaetota bacterium]HON16079.1 hypothetical protein [Spirochaetota bacterium]